MTSELSFLLDMLLNHKLPSATKVLVSDRIREVERNLNSIPLSSGGARVTPLRMTEEGMTAIQKPPPSPVAVIAHTPAAAAALASRAEAMAGKLDKDTGRPRKF